MASTELVGPLPKVIFGGGTAARGVEKSWLDPGVAIGLAEPLPTDTADPRYAWCTDHHTACVCREAEHAESLGEYRAMYLAAANAAKEILAGHRTRPRLEYTKRLVGYVDGEEVWEEFYDEAAVCSCTGCQIARKAFLL